MKQKTQEKENVEQSLLWIGNFGIGFLFGWYHEWIMLVFWVFMIAVLTWVSKLK